MDDDHAALFADVLDLGSYEIIRRDGARIELTIHQCVILGVLAQARGRWKAKQTLAAAIWGGQGEWARTWDQAVRGDIHDLRARIEGCSFSIDSDGRNLRGLGYRLLGPIRVRALDGTMTPCPP